MTDEHEYVHEYEDGRATGTTLRHREGPEVSGRTEAILGALRNAADEAISRFQPRRPA